MMPIPLIRIAMTATTSSVMVSALEMRCAAARSPVKFSTTYCAPVRCLTSNSRRTSSVTSGYCSGAGRLGVEHAEKILSGRRRQGAMRNERRLTLNLRRTKRRDALAERADHRQRQRIDPSDRADRIFVGEHASREALGQQAHFRSQRELVIVEIASFDDREIANVLKSGGHTDQPDPTLLSTRHDGCGLVPGARHVDDVGNFRPDGLQVADPQFVCPHRRAIAVRVHARCVHKVRPDAFDLLDDVLLRRGSDADHQHDRGAAEHDAERAENRPRSVFVEGAERDAPGLSRSHQADSVEIALGPHPS